MHPVLPQIEVSVLSWILTSTSYSCAHVVVAGRVPRRRAPNATFDDFNLRMRLVGQMS